jgi:Flp pilus assembly protein TadG
VSGPHLNLADLVSRRLSRLADSRSKEGGYITILVAVLFTSGFLMAALAISADTARWYDEMNRVQKAADAAALAGVPYLPFDLTNATVRAKEVAKRNGYDDADPDVVVTVVQGTLASQLKVTISSRIDNTFGGFIGLSRTTLERSATADYKGPAPMGSPCNSFGNEPDAGAGASSPTPTDTALGTELPACKRLVDFWAGIQGVRSAKSNGDRYMNSYCNTSTSASPPVPHPVYGCTGNVNTEHDPAAGTASPGKRGYVWVVRVQPNAVNQPITLQVYDAAYVNGGDFNCGSLPASSALLDNMNPFVTTDGKRRYSNDLAKAAPLPGQGAPFCNGDAVPAHAEGSNPAPTTTFVLRHQTDTQDPMQGTPMTGCTKQYKGVSTVPTFNTLRSTHSSYNEQLAQLFHNWTTLCSFTPTVAGDYYLQIRTNVSFVEAARIPNNLSNPSLISNGDATAYAASGNTNTGVGTNNFAVRAVIASGLQDEVSVSGYDRMPIFANKEAATSEFHLIRVLPGAAGQYISFSFFDVADADGAEQKYIQVVAPADATGSIDSTPFPSPGCQSYFGSSTTKTALTNCRAPMSAATNNGKLATIEIPIPHDYTCDVSKVDHCWYRVEVFYGSGGVHDFTTWDATIIGDPVRLIK